MEFGRSGRSLPSVEVLWPSKGIAFPTGSCRKKQRSPKRTSVPGVGEREGSREGSRWGLVGIGRGREGGEEGKEGEGGPIKG